MNKKIHILKSKLIAHKEINYGFFSRMGGISSKPFDTLNCGLNSGDSINNVKKNIKLAMNSLSLRSKDLIIGNQYHSNKVIKIKNHYKKKYKADGFVTKNKNVAIGILTADCAPIFFYDNKNKIIGAAHAGWKGCLNNICNSIIESMNSYGSNNINIEVIIGPCIGYQKYEVGKDLYNEFIIKDLKYKKYFKKKINNKFTFNLAGALRYQLINKKLKKIIMLNKDTFTNHKKYFSHRRSIYAKKGKTGRMINIIGFAKN